MAEQLTLAVRNYDRTVPILRGDVIVPGADLRTIETTEVAAMFTGMFTGEYDISKMSLAEVIYARSRGLDDFIAIPVFPYRMFRHGFIFATPGVGVDSAQDISGKRVALTRAVVTAGVWMRGMLTERYGVSAADTSWHYASIHHWQGKGESEDVTPRDGSTYRLLTGTGPNPQAIAERALLEGEVDVLCTTRAPADADNGSGRVVRVFDRYPESEAAYFEQTRIFPIMHVLAIRRSAVAAAPDLPVALFEAFAEAKRISKQRVEADASVSLAWKDYYLAKEREVLGDNPWAYGLEANRHALVKFLGYCHEQGLSAKELEPEDLFAEGTWALTD